MDFSSLSTRERQEMEQIISDRQVNDTMQMYSTLVSRCFKDCIHDFTSKKLTAKENKCLDKCLDKFVKYSERVSLRFGELNAQQQPPSL